MWEYDRLTFRDKNGVKALLKHDKGLLIRTETVCFKKTVNGIETMISLKGSVTYF